VFSLVITPFWATIETDMPVEIWKQLLDGTDVMLAAGLEFLIRAFSDSKLFQTNSLETVRGAAISYLARGVDRIYFLIIWIVKQLLMIQQITGIFSMKSETLKP
jgi:hypothetical protein